ncbi:hypothetical protein ACIP86_25920 [Pseudomonas neuropathica]
MMSGRVGQLGELRIWCNEPHVAFCGLFDVEESVLPFSNVRFNNSVERSLVLEVMLPRGGRTIYGLLGLRYFPSYGSMISIKVTKQACASKVYQDSLISNFETINVGLPTMYANASVAGLKRAFSDSLDVGPGLIEICYAAFGDVSSNEQIFEKMGYSLANLLSLQLDEISIDAVGALLLGSK